MEQESNELMVRFNNRLNELIAVKNKNTQILSKKAYLNLIDKIKVLKAKVTRKMPEDYQRLRRYDVVSIGGLEKLIVPVKDDNVIKFYVHTDEIFQILHDTHITLGHGGRNPMEKFLNSKYRNITREMIMVYLNLCEICQERASKKSSAIKPNLSAELNSKCQVDVIDMESRPDEVYKFILVYKDHCTKYVQLRPLKSQSPVEIADSLLDIFTIFGAPNILQSSKGIKFSINIIKELCNTWNELKMVYGKYEQYDNTNEDIENALNSWMQSKNTNRWSEGLKFVQLMKNREHRADFNCTSHEVMFGLQMKVDLNTSVSLETVKHINTEEDLDLLYRRNNDNEATEDMDPSYYIGVTEISDQKVD